MTPIPESMKRQILAEIERRGLQIPNEGRTPPSGGSGVTRESVPEGIPIGPRPSASCQHDFVFLRDNYSHIQAHAAQGLMPRIPAEMKDTFYCQHCLEYREVKR